MCIRDSPCTLNTGPSACDFAFEGSPLVSFITVNIIVVTALRALAVNQVRNGPVGNIRIVPQGIVRFLRAGNLANTQVMVRLVGKWKRRLVRNLSRERSCYERHVGLLFCYVGSWKV